jgi:hypothetical protein
LRRYRHHVKQLSIAQLSRYQAHIFSLTGRFIDVAQGGEKSCPPRQCRPLIPRTCPHSLVPLRQIIYELLSRTLQVIAVRLHRAESHPMSEDSLPIVLTIAAFRSEPNGIATINLTPVIRHTQLDATIEY